MEYKSTHRRRLISILYLAILLILLVTHFTVQVELEWAQIDIVSMYLEVLLLYSASTSTYTYTYTYTYSLSSLLYQLSILLPPIKPAVLCYSVIFFFILYILNHDT